MRVALRGAPTSAMPMPEGIVTVRINRKTGCPASASDPPEGVMFEVFEQDNVPQCENQENQVDIFNQGGDDSDGERVDPIF
jgi:penicillin-binding protein 1A